MTTRNILGGPEPSDEQNWIGHYLRLADQLRADRWLLWRAEAAAENSELMLITARHILRETAARLRESSELLRPNRIAHGYKKAA